MSLFLFVIFIVLPVAEIAVFIQASHLIGVPAVIALTLTTAFAGSYLMRTQGFAAFNRFMMAVEKGETPILPILDGMGILTAGVLLLTPGLLTDTVGLLLFIPWVRRALGRIAFRYLLSSGKVKFHFHNETDWTDFRGGRGPKPGGRAKNNKPRRSENVVDAEFETIDPKNGKNGATPAQRTDEDNGAPNKQSPWHKN